MYTDKCTGTQCTKYIYFTYSILKLESETRFTFACKSRMKTESLWMLVKTSLLDALWVSKLNDQFKLLAAVKWLRYSNVVIYTDSQFLISPPLWRLPDSNGEKISATSQQTHDIKEKFLLFYRIFKIFRRQSPGTNNLLYFNRKSHFFISEVFHSFK